MAGEDRGRERLEQGAEGTSQPDVPRGAGPACARSGSGRCGPGGGWRRPRDRCAAVRRRRRRRGRGSRWCRRHDDGTSAGWCDGRGAPRPRARGARGPRPPRGRRPRGPCGRGSAAAAGRTARPARRGRPRPAPDVGSRSAGRSSSARAMTRACSRFTVPASTARADAVPPVLERVGQPTGAGRRCRGCSGCGGPARRPGSGRPRRRPRRRTPPAPAGAAPAAARSARESSTQGPACFRGRHQHRVDAVEAASTAACTRAAHVSTGWSRTGRLVHVSTLDVTADTFEHLFEPVERVRRDRSCGCQTARGDPFRGPHASSVRVHTSTSRAAYSSGE